ncbi:MAG: hypothetical protein IPP79_19280 [Chitinophagaceae bacterium]|nr:hypothetical protein [Chitinophagaceae bacterium]
MPPSGFSNASPKYLVRLSEYSDDDKNRLVDSINDLCQNVITQIDINKLPFIQSLNCSLILQVSESDTGLLNVGEEGLYVCLLTLVAYRSMVEIIENVKYGHNWLTPGEYLDEPAFLISKYGSW